MPEAEDTADAFLEKCPPFSTQAEATKILQVVTWLVKELTKTGKVAKATVLQKKYAGNIPLMETAHGITIH